MSSILDELKTAAETTDQESVEQQADIYPVVQWVFGRPANKKIGGMDYFGGWFVNKEMMDLEGVDGWVAETLTHADGSETEGFYTPSLSFAIIRDRKRWEVNSNNKRYLYAWNDYDAAVKVGRASGRTHILVLIKGLEDRGPFTLTLKGISAMAVEGTRQQAGAIQQFVRTVIRRANDDLKKAKVDKRLPYRAFWLTVGCPKDDKGAPVFTLVGSGEDSSNLTLPVPYGLPKKAEDVNLADYYVGKEIYEVANKLHEDTAEWTTAWDAITPGTSSETNGDETTDVATAVIEEATISEAAAELGI